MCIYFLFYLCNVSFAFLDFYPISTYAFSLMKVAVVGAGFAGLALCYYLLEKGHQVELFDAKEVGAGASGVSSGLMHPYVGERANRSLYATEALEESKKLLAIAQEFVDLPVADYSGILRKSTKEQSEKLRQYDEWKRSKRGFSLLKAVWLSTLKGIYLGFLPPFKKEGLSLLKRRLSLSTYLTTLASLPWELESFLLKRPKS